MYGSSPHTWGIPTLPSMTPGATRFIPTYVGHTALRPQWPAVVSVHPHIRGAYLPVFFLVTAFVGSSPHTWGIRFPLGWSTPTRPVHPHIRGAYPLQDVRISKSVGSSPHTWGIPCAPLIEGDVNRFIPTYVGHTLRRGRRGRVRLVHPHIRGAYCGVQFTHCVIFRFIPTYVGHTVVNVSG